MIHVSGKALVVSIALSCLLPGRPSPEASDAPATWQAGCGQSMDALNRLQADLGLDRALADRINSLTEAARGSGQAPPASELESLAEDGLDGLADAGEQLEQAADDIGSQLQEMNMARQHTAWSRGVQRLRTARTNLQKVARPGSIGARRAIGSTSATGVGPQWIAEAAGAAGDVGSAAENLNRIALDGQFNHIARGAASIQQGAADTNPPPNPGPDRWQEMLKRLQAQQGRLRNNLKGLNAARSLQGRQFQQAQQNSSEMQQAMQEAQGFADQLGQMAALCNQANQQQQQQQQQQPAQSNPAPPAQAAASGGGGMGAALGIAAAGAAAAGGYALYAASATCTAPDWQANYNACSSLNCGACRAAYEQLVPYCDCVEEKHPEEAAGVGSICRDVVAALRQTEQYCLAPAFSTPVPQPAIRK